jgi:hypothetical protein
MISYINSRFSEEFHLLLFGVRAPAGKIHLAAAIVNVTLDQPRLGSHIPVPWTFRALECQFWHDRSSTSVASEFPAPAINGALDRAVLMNERRCNSGQAHRDYA